MAGPCMCGDLYCPSCGNPAEAALADWQESLCERLSEAKVTHDETVFIDGLLFPALEAYRAGKKIAVSDVNAAAGAHIDALEQEMVELKARLKRA